MEWLLLLLLGKRKPKEWLDLPPVPGGGAESHPVVTDATTVPPYSAERLAKLVKRAAAGAAWAERFRAAGLDPDLADALARWAGIESGGNPHALSKKLGERGLLQTMRESAVKAGGEALWTRYGASTPEADAVVVPDSITLYRYAEGLANRDSWPGKWGGIDRTWRAKLYHGLPLLLRELAEQGILGNGRAGLRSRWSKYKPSRKVASYGVPTRDSRGLWERFAASADVVAYGGRPADD